MSKSTSIPSDEDFERASAVVRNRSRGLSQLRDEILAQFKGDVYECFIMDCSETAFKAYVFYRWSYQVEEAEHLGLSERVRSAILDGLERNGRGKRSAIQVSFEFDSHEKVEMDYEGDYFNRLR